MAFEALQETQPTATGLLKVCAFLAPDDIPYSLLRDHASALPKPLDHMVTDDLQWDDALKALRHYALIEAAEESLSIHRLVQAITRDRLAVEERAQWAEAAMQCVAALFPSGNAADDPRTWPIYARLFPHASSAISHVGEMDNAKANSTLLLQMGFYLERRAQFAEARPYFERALAISEQVLGPEHPDTALSLNNLGYLLQAQGDLAGAKPYYERALAISEQVLGPEHPDTALSLNNLGYLLQAQGDLAGAKPYYERALHIFRLRLGQDHPYTQTVQANLEALELAE
jgi:tetratricopeptide (TPR) repeat protein